MLRFCGFCILIFFITSSSLGDGVIRRHGKILASRVSTAPEPCASADSTCHDLLSKSLTGIGLFEISASTGYLAGAGKPSWSVETLVAGHHFPIGDVALGRFKMSKIKNDRSERYQFQLVDLRSLFFCRHPNGKIKAPLLGPLQDRCQGRAAWALNASLFALQWDRRSERFLGRWLSLGVGYNFFRNGQGLGSLYRRLNFFVDVDYQTVSSRAQGPAKALWGRTVGGTVGLEPMYRSGSGRWEFKGKVALRKVLFKGYGRFKDNQVLGRLGGTYNFLFSENTLGKWGLEVEGSFFKFPVEARGRFSSENKTRELYFGSFLTLKPRMDI